VVNKYPMAGVTPGPLAFDGSYIWMLSNGNGVSQIIRVPISRSAGFRLLKTLG
jgi:hypothetical protein